MKDKEVINLAAMNPLGLLGDKDIQVSKFYFRIFFFFEKKFRHFENDCFLFCFFSKAPLMLFVNMVVVLVDHEDFMEQLMSIWMLKRFVG